MFADRTTRSRRNPKTVRIATSAGPSIAGYDLPLGVGQKAPKRKGLRQFVERLQCEPIERTNRLAMAEIAISRQRRPEQILERLLVPRGKVPKRAMLELGDPPNLGAYDDVESILTRPGTVGRASNAMEKRGTLAVSTPEKSLYASFTPPSMSYTPPSRTSQFGGTIRAASGGDQRVQKRRRHPRCETHTVFGGSENSR